MPEPVVSEGRDRRMEASEATRCASTPPSPSTTLPSGPHLVDGQRPREAQRDLPTPPPPPPQNFPRTEMIFKRRGLAASRPPHISFTHPLLSCCPTYLSLAASLQGSVSTSKPNTHTTPTQPPPPRHFRPNDPITVAHLQAAGQADAPRFHPELLRRHRHRRRAQAERSEADQRRVAPGRVEALHLCRGRPPEPHFSHCEIVCCAA